MLPNRIALYFTAFAALCAAVVPVVADFDTSSTVGVIGGVGALAAVVGVWLYNWGKYEERTALEPLVEEQLAQAAGEAYVASASKPGGTTLERPKRVQ